MVALVKHLDLVDEVPVFIVSQVQVILVIANATSEDAFVHVSVVLSILLARDGTAFVILAVFV